MKSSQFLYNRVSVALSSYLPEATLEYSDSFWNDFEPYFYQSEGNVQAFVGELVCIDQKYTKCVFKISQSEDNLVLNEYKILRRAVELLGMNFPHICKPFGIVKYKSHISIEKGFHVDGDEEKYVYRDMLLIEHIPHISCLEDFLYKQDRKDILLSVCKQVLVCINIFRRIRLTHYDLHTSNILVRACPPDLVLEYKLGEETIRIPTFGYMIVIIDFGYSFVQDEKSYLYSNLRCAALGILSDRFMPYSDYIRFLYHVSYNVRKSGNKTKHLLRKNTFSIFRNYSNSLIKKNGLEKSSSRDMIDILEEEMNQYKLVLFDSFDWIEQIQSLIETPLNNPKPARKKGDFDSFCKEWSKIEERVTDIHVVCYLFKYLIHCIKIYYSHAHSFDIIKSVFLDEFTRLIQSFLPSIDYKVLIVSILDIVEWFQEFLYVHLKARQEEMLGLYKALPFTVDTCDKYIWSRFEELHCTESNNVFLFQM